MSRSISPEPESTEWWDRRDEQGQFRSWQNHPDAEQPSSFRLTKRGERVAVAVALLLFLIAMAVVGGIEQGTL